LLLACLRGDGARHRSVVEDYNWAIEDNLDDAALVGLLQQQRTVLQDEIRSLNSIAK
jgi:hypothetical protein